jgi:hypothetical protein
MLHDAESLSLWLSRFPMEANGHPSIFARYQSQTQTSKAFCFNGTFSQAIGSFDQHVLA